MKNLGGEKVLSVRVPYIIYAKIDEYVRQNNLTKTEIINNYLKELVEELEAKKEMEDLGIMPEREQLRESLRDIKNGRVRPAREFMQEMKEKLNIQDDE